jgi:hypothetical protein
VFAPEILALYIIFTHTLPSAEVATRLGILSPTSECGKSKLLEILALLVPDPLPTSNTSPAAIYRSLLNATPTLLIDEADTFMDTQAELTGILNSGHTRPMAYVNRCVKLKDTQTVVKFPTFCAMAIARIGELPSQLESRSIIIRMQRAAPGEQLTRIKSQHRDELQRLKERITKWASNGGCARLKDADPPMPEHLSYRQADNWRHFIAIADVAGGEWPSIARSAAARLSKQVGTTVGERVLAEIKRVFDANLTRVRFASTALCQEINNNSAEEVEWTPQTLAHELRNFGISPKAMRVDGKSVRGYERSQFEDAWRHYSVDRGLS